MLKYKNIIQHKTRGIGGVSLILHPPMCALAWCTFLRGVLAH